MEEYPIKLERVAPAMNDLIGKLQSFNTFTTSEKSSAVRDILTTVENLRSCLKNSVGANNCKKQTNFDNQIERIFSEFNWNVNYTIKPNDYQKFILCCKSLSASVMKMLGKKNCGILVVEMHLRMCVKLINQLYDSVDENVNVLKDLLLFQLLVKGFSSSVRILKKFWNIIILPKQKCSLMLCLNQSFKTLCLLGKIIDRRLNHLIKYLLNRLKQCLNKALDLLFNPEECHSSEFIILMDSCLNKLDSLSYEVDLHEDSNKRASEMIASIKPLLDELLCHAMIISHISNRETDCSLIKSYSQKVLDEFKIMTEEENKDIPASSERLSNVLCQLEETVNTAVLNVVLDVFIDINEPLRNLVDKCNGKMEDCHNKSATDLENEISIFDEHMDRIMHVGLFAVSCSTDVKRILEIQSCLASLESLEAELITSVISLYLNPNKEAKMTFQFIFRNWLGEINELKNLIDLILDPAAFCQVVEKRISALMYEIKDDEEISVSKIRSNMTKILAIAKKLIKTLSKSTERDDEEVTKKMKECIENLQLAYQECEASVSLLDQEILPKEISDRMTKRIGLVIASITNIIRNINDTTDVSEQKTWVEDTPIVNVDCNEKSDFYKLNVVSLEMNDTIDMEVLTPYINRGKERTKERTILYMTPKVMQHFQNTPKKIDLETSVEFRSSRGSFQSRSRSRCCRPLPRTLEWENSLDLELTALLENVTDLSSTFKTTFRDVGVETLDVPEEYLNSESSVIVTPVQPASDGRVEDDSGEKVFLGTIMRQKLDKSLKDLSNSTSLSINEDSKDNQFNVDDTNGLTDSKCRFETPDRMHDLLLVEEKINFLMEHMKD